MSSLLENTDPEIVKICFDTGHTVVAGGDPVELARSARDRIAHLDLRVTPGVGAGYQWIERPDFNFSTEAGLSRANARKVSSGKIM